MQINARIPEEHIATAMRHSGEDGVFCREIFTSEADKAKHNIVWLDSDCSLEAALRQSKRVEGSVGLIANDRGLGVRVVKEQHKSAVATLQGDAAAQVLDHSLFEASGVPVWWTQDTLEECLMEWGWEAKGVSRGYVKNGRRVWILKAKDSPSGAYMQTDEGLVTVQCAKKLPPRGPVATNRWRRGSGPVAEVSWSQVWTEKPTKPAGAVAPVVAPSATAPPFAVMTVQAPSQANFVPGTPQAANTAAPGTPVGDSAAPAPMDIAALIAQALAPHMSVVTSLEQHLVFTSGPSGPLGECRRRGASRSEAQAQGGGTGTGSLSFCFSCALVSPAHQSNTLKRTAKSQKKRVIRRLKEQSNNSFPRLTTLWKFKDCPSDPRKHRKLRTVRKERKSVSCVRSVRATCVIHLPFISVLSFAPGPEETDGESAVPGPRECNRG